MTIDWPKINRAVDAVPLRGTRRDSLFVSASIHVARSGHDAAIVIRNISSGGLLADSAQGFEIGDAVVVTLRKVGAVPGRIVWVRPGRFGMAFDVTIDPHDVRKPVTLRKAPAPRTGRLARAFAMHGRNPQA